MTGEEGTASGRGRSRERGRTGPADWIVRGTATTRTGAGREQAKTVGASASCVESSAPLQVCPQ